MPKIVASFLSREQEFQLLQAEDARAVAVRHGYEIEVLFADLNAVEQIQHLFRFIHRPAEQRPAAIVAETVTGEGLERVARNAAQAGIGWVLLNRKVAYLDELRARYPALPLSTVGTDQVEVGRLQGRQLRALLPSGGVVLYVQGPPDTSVAQERLAGVRETAGAGIELRVLAGQWTEASGEKALQAFLRLKTNEGFVPRVVACQNDAMAVGARRAIAGLADPDRRAAWRPAVYMGCDGLPSSGQRLVREGVLAATVVTPSNAGPAVDLVVEALRSGKPAPPAVSLNPTSCPDLEGLRPLR
ncbi:MAG TPA: substrate-binding domain-containing protein [Vicinamibacteria bacterium]